MKIAFIFPGQGAQSVGMMADLATAHAQVKETFDEASEALGYDLWQLTQDGPEETLNQTDKTQPAMLAAGIAAARVWLAQGGAAPTMCAGHSLGEYAALVQADALSFQDAIKLVAARGEFMQTAVPAGEGAMAAVLGLDDAQIEEVCTQSAQGDVVSPANYNAPGQVVIAGSKPAVDRAIEAAKAAGAKRAMPLAVSVPSHCDLMRPAEEKLTALLNTIDIRVPALPVIHNVDAASRDTVEAIRTALGEQLYRPVRWVACAEKIAAEGAEAMLECGPGKVLTGLNKRIVKNVPTLPVFDTATLEKALAETNASS